MANLQRPLAFGALLAGSGVAAYYGGRWLMHNCFGRQREKDSVPTPAQQSSRDMGASARRVGCRAPRR
jgi:hypothetical protein